MKQYGSQANYLAVDSSDVDLAVTGLPHSFDRHQSMLTLEMHLRKNLWQILRSDEDVEFIYSASVPVIKMKVDLQKVQEFMREKARKELDPEDVESVDDIQPYV